MKQTRISNGVHWIEAPDQDLTILCGCPADTVKHLMRQGRIETIERDGTTFETGPNAILLSDIPVQNGEFANLSEFPVLQMLYRQGMILPNHPNNTGRKPLIIGTADQVAAQREYIYRGNYGLVSEQEIEAAGVEPERAKTLMAMKRAFAFGTIRKPEELLDFIVVEDEPVEIASGLTVERTASNTYRFATAEEETEVCLSLSRGEQYAPPYVLGQHKIKPEYFSVVHTGDGNGWDVNRPCMASVLVFQGRTYLIDAGPSVMSTLSALGLSVNEIDGIFHTHGHDDHFAGLTSLVRADHRIPYYATPLVRASVAKKMAALMSFDESEFERLFVVHDLVEGEWNMIDGLEVRPVFSPHPVETTVMFFRTLWNEGYRSYAHFADVCSLERLDSILDSSSSDAAELREQVKRDYLTPTDIKKLDIGGGLIHGNAADFETDRSRRIVLSHIDRPLTLAEKEIGSDSAFGMSDVLVRQATRGDDLIAAEFLRETFPDVPYHEIAMLSNCEASTLSIGSMLVKKRSEAEAVYLLLNGLVEILDATTRTHNILTPGSLIGERPCLRDEVSTRTYRAASFVRVLTIPCTMYRAFIERNKLAERMTGYLERRHFLEGSYLFGDRINGLTLNSIARMMMTRKAGAGDAIDISEGLAIVSDGSVDVHLGSAAPYNAGPGVWFGEAERFARDASALVDSLKIESSYIAGEPTTYHLVPWSLIETVPIVRWKLREQFNRRCRADDRSGCEDLRT